MVYQVDSIYLKHKPFTMRKLLIALIGILLLQACTKEQVIAIANKTITEKIQYKWRKISSTNPLAVGQPTRSVYSAGDYLDIRTDGKAYQYVLGVPKPYDTIPYTVSLDTMKFNYYGANNALMATVNHKILMVNDTLLVFLRTTKYYNPSSVTNPITDTLKR